MSGKGVGSNSSSLVMSEGLFYSMRINPYSHLQILLLRRGRPAAGILLCVGVPAWKISRICPERRVET